MGRQGFARDRAQKVSFSLIEDLREACRPDVKSGENSTVEINTRAPAPDQKWGRGCEQRHGIAETQ